MVFLSQQSKQKWSKIKIGIFTAMFLLQYFCLLDICVPNHNLKLKAPDQPQSAGRTVFWHMILHSSYCNVLCKFFIKIESNCFSKTFSEIESTWPLNSSKEEIFCPTFHESFWSKLKAHWGMAKNRHPSWLYCFMVGLSEASTWDVV